MEKNRNLSKSEYFDAIQREYIIADFKSKFFVKTKDRKYYARVAEYKREKIEDIARKNNLISILNNEEKYDEVRSTLISDNNQPLFEMSEIDFQNYFCVGCEYAYKGEIWTLKSLDGVQCYIENKNGDQKSVLMSEISRIL